MRKKSKTNWTILKKLYRFSCQKVQIQIRYNFSEYGSDLAKKLRILRDPNLQDHNTGPRTFSTVLTSRAPKSWP